MVAKMEIPNCPLAVATVVTACELVEEPLLLAGLGSGVVEVATAELVNVPRAEAVTVTVKVSAPPFGREDMFGQVITPLASAPPPEALTKTTLVGRKSFSNTLVAGDGPALVTLMV